MLSPKFSLRFAYREQYRARGVLWFYYVAYPVLLIKDKYANYKAYRSLRAVIRKYGGRRAQ